ncbi:hypothetical protein AAFM79_02950 [Trichormus azollae HNT15244]
MSRYLFTDVDRLTISEKRAEALEKIELNLKNKPCKTLHRNYELKIIFLKVRIETRLLGHENFLPRNIQLNEILSKYIIKYFNVRLSDPEGLANKFE